ncbi:MAG: PLDc N-terminal domain-containing protein [Candidatus Woesearchaeota archaeon]
MVLSWIFGVLALASIVWVIIDVFTKNKRLSAGMKVLWTVLAILFSIITAVVYYFIGRNGKVDFFK